MAAEACRARLRREGRTAAGAEQKKRREHGQAAGKDKRATASKAVLRQTQRLKHACQQHRCKRGRQPLNNL
eukprot:6019278-Alexandrium_andersonii.AAC.1